MDINLSMQNHNPFIRNPFTSPKMIITANHKRKTFFVATILLALSSLTTETSATPSTQIWIPSTDIQGFLTPHIGWDVYITAFDATTVISNGGITVGLLPSTKMGIEAGVDYREFSGLHGNPILFNLKYGIYEDSLSKYQPAIAIGAYDFGTKNNFSNFNLLYGIAAKTIWKLGRFSVGGYKGVGPKVLWMSSTGKLQNAGVIASWDRYINEISNKLWLAVDFQSGDNSYGAINFGIAWNFAPNVSLMFGYDIFNDSALYQPSFTLQFDMNLLWGK
jgi:hypothetical protein